MIQKVSHKFFVMTAWNVNFQKKFFHRQPTRPATNLYSKVIILNYTSNIKSVATLCCEISALNIGLLQRILRFGGSLLLNVRHCKRSAEYSTSVKEFWKSVNRAYLMKLRKLSILVAYFLWTTLYEAINRNKVYISGDSSFTKTATAHVHTSFLH